MQKLLAIQKSDLRIVTARWRVACPRLKNVKRKKYKGRQKESKLPNYEGSDHLALTVHVCLYETSGTIFLTSPKLKELKKGLMNPH